MAIPPSEIARDKTLLRNIETITGQTVRRLMPDLRTLEQYDAGGVIRQVANTVSLSMGNVATTAAVESYSSMSVAALDELLKDAASLPDKGEVIRLARGLAWAREHQAKTIAVAPVIRKNVDSVIGLSMKNFMDGRFPDAEMALEKGVARLVANIYRDTMATNSYNDQNATGYQRVASPTACSFCMVVALNEYTTFDQSGGYHDSCGCTAVPIFRGVGSFRPDYYDQFEADYFAGRAEADSSSTTQILSEIRASTGRK